MCEENLGSFLFDDLHLRLESLLRLVGQENILLGVTATSQILFHLCISFSEMQFVESSLQQVELVFLRSFVAVRYFLYTVEYFLFGSIGFCLGF